MNQPFQGTVVPAVTPYLKDGTVDFKGVESVFAHFDSLPAVDGIFVTGAMGDYSVLTTQERKKIMDIALGMNLTKDWVPNTSTLERDTSIELARYAASRGIGTIGVIFPRQCTGFAEVMDYVREILALGVRVFIYQTGNSPYPLSVDELGQLLALQNIVGMKDSCSGRDMYRHVRYISEFGQQIVVIQGIEMLYLSSLAVGARGVIGGGLNVYPQLLTGIRSAYDAGDVRGAAQLQAEVNSLYETISDENTTLAAIKYYLALCGVPIGTTPRKDEPPLSEAKKAYMRGLYERLKIPM